MFATEDSEHDVDKFILHPKDFNVNLCGANMERDLARRIASRSLLLADGRDFTLASGQTSDRFCDLKPAMLDPHTSSRITDGLLDIITILEPDFVGGLELGLALGSTPHAEQLALVATPLWYIPRPS